MAEGDDGVPVASGTGNALSTPIKFDASPNDGNLLICKSPQNDGYRCAGFATTYALILTGALGGQSQRQTDSAAWLDLFKAIGYTPQAQESAAFTAFVNGSMRPSDVTFMASAIYAAGILKGWGSQQYAGYTAAGLTSYLYSATAFGAFSGAQLSLLLYTFNAGSAAHWICLHVTDYANSMPNPPNPNASVQSGPNMPADAQQVVSIDLNSSGVTLTKQGQPLGSTNGAPLGLSVTIAPSTVSHDAAGVSQATTAANAILSPDPEHDLSTL